MSLRVAESLARRRPSETGSRPCRRRYIPLCNVRLRVIAGHNVERRGLRCYYFARFLASARCVAQIARRGQGFQGTMEPAACNEAGRDEFNPRVSCYAISRVLLPPPPFFLSFSLPPPHPLPRNKNPPPRILSTSGRVRDYSFFPKFKIYAFSTPEVGQSPSPGITSMECILMWHFICAVNFSCMLIRQKIHKNTN